MVKLAMWDFKQCDAARCSGRKLRRHGKLIELRKNQRWKGIILCAEAEVVLSPADADIVREKGICVIDCSWNRTNEVPTKKLLAGGIPRKLPFLRAANPCHFGRPFELNCAEAIAATLFITGFIDESVDIMSSFKWGHTFFSVNEESLDLYSEAGLQPDDIAGLEALMQTRKFRIRSAKEMAREDDSEEETAEQLAPIQEEKLRFPTEDYSDLET
eukprot:Gregarina_sp_Poly_1__1865@NODE_1486_length_4017_cov_36_481013_g984_i0_p2_GENE_NODE_1486_length_4017_cov_36_481013_g984_i0NODE_1486_length_4017_cov_36_481013_g984_i0_p2_ORF_typecomplete_len215_score49_45Ribo_biogen_C/PF04034_13/2_8e40RLI/PF04068_15/4e09DUF370/PF04025_12/0_17_NODE_1486_length_4017_cov_36_481013_g984_i033393983